MWLYSANGKYIYRYSFINLCIWHSVIYIALSSLKVLTALGKLTCKEHLHNQLYRYMYVFYNNANGNEVFDCAYMQSTLL